MEEIYLDIKCILNAMLSVWYGKCSATCSLGTMIKRCNFYVCFNNQVGTSRYEYEMAGINDLGKVRVFSDIYYPEIDF